ncbi:uncharacterized protein [Dysidea avara]|uniref:uncharacterized protein isoform X2 n=1 Tax=Dysidea avara TaxID=196820 RepID=UPI003323AA9D
MLKILLLSLIVAVCYAQTPPRPMIQATFESKVEFFLHEHDTYQGMGHIAFNEALNRGVEFFTYDRDGKNETSVDLERYDMGLEYFIRGGSTLPHCESRKLQTAKMPSYWDWVAIAKYAGQRKGSTVRNELLVERENPNVPRYVNNEISTIRRELGFLTFNTTAPPATMFEVPFECKGL